MLSIIIPTLNEAATLEQTVLHTRAAANGADIAFIVSDCGSADGTVETAQRMGLRVVGGGDCRAAALNLGARTATGDVFLFLHADSLLPYGFPHLIFRALSHRDVVGGAFDFEFMDDPKTSRLDRECLRWVVLCNRIRYRWTGNYYGDQTLFVRREVHEKIGGFPLVHLMEDIRFSRRMRGLGRTAILHPPVRTSPRRFLRRGVIRQFVEDLTLLGCDSFGVCPASLWARYNRWNRDNGIAATGDRRADMIAPSR